MQHGHGFSLQSQYSAHRTHFLEKVANLYVGASGPPRENIPLKTTQQFGVNAATIRSEPCLLILPKNSPATVCSPDGLHVRVARFSENYVLRFLAVDIFPDYVAMLDSEFKSLSIACCYKQARRISILNVSTVYDYFTGVLEGRPDPASWRLDFLRNDSTGWDTLVKICWDRLSVPYYNITFGISPQRQ